MGDKNPNFMAGVPELLILRLLQAREMYGYEIVEAITEVSGSAINFGEGVVYTVLHGLEADGALSARRKAVGGRTRVYYSLTAKGSRRFTELADTWSSLSEAIALFLKDAGHVSKI